MTTTAEVGPRSRRSDRSVGVPAVIAALQGYNEVRLSPPGGHCTMKPSMKRTSHEIKRAQDVGLPSQFELLEGRKPSEEPLS